MLGTDDLNYEAERDARLAAKCITKAENALEDLTTSESATVYALLGIYYKLSEMRFRMNL